MMDWQKGLIIKVYVCVKAIKEKPMNYSID